VPVEAALADAERLRQYLDAHGAGPADTESVQSLLNPVGARRAGGSCHGGSLDGRGLTDPPPYHTLPYGWEVRQVSKGGQACAHFARQLKRATSTPRWRCSPTTSSSAARSCSGPTAAGRPCASCSWPCLACSRTSP